MEILSNILKTANRILIAQSQRDYKNFLRQKLLKENPNLDELQLSTKIGQLCKEVKDGLRSIKSNYYQYVYKWLIQGGLPKDIDGKFKDYLQQYQYLKNNNKQHIQIPKNILDYFKNLSDFIQDYNNDNQPLNISVEKQKVRKQDLPFKHIDSNGNYNMYIIEDGQYQDFNRLYGNNNNSQYGGLIATSSWCVTLDIRNFKECPPYYLITNGKTAPEALVHIKSKQFKNIKNKPYQYDHPQVYQLVSNLLDKNNAKTYEKDFSVLIRFLPDQQKQQMIKELIGENEFDDLCSNIKKGYLPNILTEQQKQKCINFFIDKNKFGDLLSYIEEGYLPPLSDQKNKKCINKLIDEGWFYDLFYYIKGGKLPSLTDQQNKYCINSLIDNKWFAYLFKYIKEGYLSNTLTDQQKQLIINELFDKNKFDTLLTYITKGYLPNTLTDQQKQQCINWFIDENQFDYLLDYIKEGYLPQLSDQQKQKFINVFIYTNGRYTLLNYIKEGKFPQLSDQQNKQFVQFYINNNRFDILFDYIKKGCLQLSNQKKQQIIKNFIDENKFFSLFSYIKNGDLPALSDQQKQQIINKLIDENNFDDLFGYIKSKYLPALTKQQNKKCINKLIKEKKVWQLFNYIEEYKCLPNILTDKQKERIIKIEPYIKLSSISKKLFNIYTILKG